jgi:hypothetical protein
LAVDLAFVPALVFVFFGFVALAFFSAAGLNLSITPALVSSLNAVLVGWAPYLSHFKAFSSSTTKVTGSVNGL